MCFQVLSGGEKKARNYEYCNSSLANISYNCTDKFTKENKGNLLKNRQIKSSETQMKNANN